MATFIKKLSRCSLFIFLSLFIFSSSYAQKDFTKEADHEFESEGFYKAIDLYKKAANKESDAAKKAEIFFKIGECYRMIEEPKECQVWYEKAIKADYPDPVAILYYADAIKAEGKYDLAIPHYRQFLEKVPDDPIGKTGLESCELAQKWKDNPANFDVQNEGLINSPNMDYAPTFEDKKFKALIFSSTRMGSTGKDVSVRTGEKAADLYYSIKDNSGKWSNPIILNEPLNTDQEEGAAVLTAKRNAMFFTRCLPKENSEKEMICHIYTAKKTGLKWDNIQRLSVAPDTINVGHPAISPDENILVFAATEMPGGAGQRDLWYSKFDAKQKTWSAATNLGSDVNSTGNEMYPFLHEDGSLYFASDGHPGMGQLDIFKAPRLGPEKWGKPENLRAPINSPQNDFALIFEGKTKGFFTSDRPGGIGGDDVYSFSVPPVLFVINGTVTDAESRNPIAGATVKLTGSDGSSTEIKTDKKGYYKFETKAGNNKLRLVKENTSYQIFASKEKYLNASKQDETTVGVERSTVFVHDFVLLNVSEPKEIRFPEVLYDLDKWDLRTESKDSLNFLYQVLIDNPTVIIELAAHTDSRATDEYNQELSQKRAESCVHYLIEKGIPPGRMVPKGYGEKRLLVSDKEIAKLKTEAEKEAAHQKNRRTVFSVIGSVNSEKVKK